MKSCYLICNLESGKGIKKEQLDRIVKILKKYNYKTKVNITKKPGDATRIVENIKTCDLVLSIGGDGTFNETVTGNCNRKKRLVLSHIPLGTTNDIGHMLGMNKNIEKNLKKILEGEVKQIDIGLINNKPFIYVAGFGKFINVPYETPRSLKKKLGHMAYIINGVKEFFHKTKVYEIEYEVDNKKYKGLYSLILISNASRVAGFDNIYRDVKLDDDRFEIMFCNITRRQTLVKSVLIMMKDGIENVPGITLHRTNTLTIKFKEAPSKSWTIDGEKLTSKDKEKTFKISIDKNTKMLLPKENIKKLFIK